MTITLDGSKIVEQVDEPKVKKIGLFDFVSDLTSDKQYLFTEATEREFNVFMINRALSQNQDTIMIANELNKHCRINKEMAHDFLYYIIPKRKRYGKWAKQDNSQKDEIDLIMKHYCVNRTRALEYLKILDKNEIENIRSQYQTGGKQK